MATETQTMMCCVLKRKDEKTLGGLSQVFVFLLKNLPLRPALQLALPYHYSEFSSMITFNYKENGEM